MRLSINGQIREFPSLAPGASLQAVLDSLDLKGDRIAVEHQGQIVSRAEWQKTAIRDEDRLEIVHFVGGGGR